MSERVTSLLGDLQHLVERISDGNNKREGGPVEGETGTSEPDTTRALSENPRGKKIGEVEDLIVDADGQVAGVVIGVDAEKNSTTALERVEVKPEPDGRVRITVFAKKRQHP
jgi:sporulation protein YlmC with PRC-barrel domain